MKNWSKDQIENLQDTSHDESFRSEKILIFLEKSEQKIKNYQFLLKIGAKYKKSEQIRSEIRLMLRIRSLLRKTLNLK